jgi:small subunit ribosomal protein S2
MATIAMKELLEAGAHFGHQTKRWNPKMKPFIYGSRNGIYIINLKLTLDLFKAAADTVGKLGNQGKTVLFIGTKRQARDVVEQEAKRCGMPYVCERWPGGMLTNHNTIRRSVALLKDLEGLETNPRYASLTKKERLRLAKEREKLDKVLAGVKEMTRLPDAVFIIDPSKEHIAVEEAVKLNIPIIAIVDTNCDPDPVRHVIPSNDDAIRAIKLFTSRLADAYLEGRGTAKDRIDDFRSEPARSTEAGPADEAIGQA